MLINWQAVQEAVEMILKGEAIRVDLNGVIVYRAGPVVRIDIKEG